MKRDHRTSQAWILGWAAASVLAAAANGQGGLHSNLSADFCYGVNPCGAWTYESAGTRVGCVLQSPNGCWRGWGCFGSYDASIMKISEGCAMPDGQPGDVMVHVSSSGYPGPMAIVWTAPAEGVLTVRGRAWALDFAPGRDARWSLVLNGEELAARPAIATVHKADTAANFQNNVLAGRRLGELPIQTGDRLVFVTNVNTFSGHFMGVEIDLDLRPCRADFNGDGFRDFFDFDAFVGCFEGGACPPGRSADFNGDGFADFFDFADFVEAFEEGC